MIQPISSSLKLNPIKQSYFKVVCFGEAKKSENTEQKEEVKAEKKDSVKQSSISKRIKNGLDNVKALFTNGAWKKLLTNVIVETAIFTAITFILHGGLLTPFFVPLVLGWHVLPAFLMGILQNPEKSDINTKSSK